MQNIPQQSSPQESGSVPNLPEQNASVSPELLKAAESELIQAEVNGDSVSEKFSGVAPTPDQTLVTDDSQIKPVTTVADETPISEEEDKAMDKRLDKRWVEMAGDVIDKYEDKPYQEEKAHEKVQIKYLWNRFRKKLSGSEDSK